MPKATILSRTLQDFGLGAGIDVRAIFGLVEHVGNGDSHASNARLAAALSGFDRDDAAVVHAQNALWQEAVSAASCGHGGLKF